MKSKLLVPGLPESTIRAAVDKLIDNIPSLYQGRMQITMNRKCYKKLCAELNRKVKSYRKLKVNVNDEAPNELIWAHPF
jgi:hypothetical protein